MFQHCRGDEGLLAFIGRGSALYEEVGGRLVAGSGSGGEGIQAVVHDVLWCSVSCKAIENLHGGTWP